MFFFCSKDEKNSPPDVLDKDSKDPDLGNQPVENSANVALSSLESSDTQPKGRKIIFPVI